MRSDKQRISVKKIAIPLIIIAALVAAFLIAKSIRASGITAEIYPVSTLNWGYMEDSMSIDGVVYDQDSQSITPDATLVIKEVYVTEGQTVKTGDKLLAYDMASQELTLQIKQISVQKSKNDVATARAELNALYNTTPVSGNSSSGSSSGGSSSGGSSSGGSGSSSGSDNNKEAHKKTKDAWNYLDSSNIDDYYLDPVVTVVINNREENANTSNDGTVVDDSDGSGSSSDAGSDNSSSDNSGDTSQDNSSSEETSDDVTYEPATVPDAGSIDNPYRYLVTEDGKIYGSFLNALKDKGDGIYASVEIREGNVTDGTLLASVLLNTSKIKKQDPDEWWYVILRTENEESSQNNSSSGTDNSGTDYFNSDTPAGYTAAELATAIADKQREIKELDLNSRRLELELKVLQEQMEDGVVTAKRDGVVTVVHDIANPPQDGSAFLKVDSGSGVTVQGTISELLLETIDIGQSISATDWDSGETYIGEITRVDDYPADTYYYYSGNPNSSFYGFLAYFDDASNLEAGRYLQMSLDTTSNLEDAIYLPNAYIRNDSQGKYVMKSEDGYLKKQYVKCGKIYYGYVTHITEGLTNDDYVAFPYGDGAVEGVRVKIGENEEVW